VVSAVPTAFPIFMASSLAHLCVYATRCEQHYEQAEDFRGVRSSSPKFLPRLIFGNGLVQYAQQRGALKLPFDKVALDAGLQRL